MATITLDGSPMQTISNLPAPGTKAPEFTVTKTDLGEVSLKDYLGKKIILNVFPSLDTPTCASAMRRFNEVAEKFPDILILCISADLPFAQKRFCSAEHLNNLQPASVFRHSNFGTIYGMTITDGPLAGLLCRAIIVINEEGKVVYSELVKELTNEPNYEAVLATLK